MRVLVKDYGHEGLQVFGITDEDAVVNAWESGDPSCRAIETDERNYLTGKALPLANRFSGIEVEA